MDQTANSTIDTVERETVEEVTAAACADHLPLPDSPNMDGVNGDPLVCPRIGHEYQVEIPVMAIESECVMLKAGDVSFDIDTTMGLEIPVTWVCHQGRKMGHEHKESPAPSACAVIAGSNGCTDTKDMMFDATLKKRDHVPVAGTVSNVVHAQNYIIKGEFDVKPCCDGWGEYKMQNFSTVDNKPDIGIPSMHSSAENVYIALPGSPPSSWSDPESQSFLLGLYIFGKDLVQVRKFIEFKKMGDILSYYYGKFYRSEAYRKWLECRKTRSRRCILGNRIFTGWRQQELLSRILPTVPKDVQDNIMEAVKSFSEGRASLEDLVSNLKANVGIRVLVEAIGIGKEKHDLTRIALDPSRSNQGLPICPEIPTGKACSSLSAEDIIKFLTGDFRLSKARSNDLFWEAVWPRLLAGGWRSEQPKDFISIGSKHSLVFITPGVKKFSRNKLVKGNHYFDSISDVLSKVASEPKLLELEVQGTAFKDENGWGLDNTVHQNDLSTQQQQHHYLRPKVPDGNAECMKFTVVDTSLFQEGGPHKLRELRTLPVDAANFPMNDKGETESESSSDDQDSDDSSSDDQGVSAPIPYELKIVGQSIPFLTEKAPLSALSDNTDPSGRISTMNGQVENKEYMSCFGGKPPEEEIERQFSPNKKPAEQAYLAPVTKRRLVMSNYELNNQQSYSKRVQFSDEKLHQQLGAVRNTESVGAIPHPSENTLVPELASCYTRGEDKHLSGEDHKDSSPMKLTSIAKRPPNSHTLIDLNILPHNSYEQETDESFKTDVSLNNLKVNLTVTSKDSEEEPTSHDSEAIDASISTAGDQHGSGNFRRQSSRNRPPTTKALEALACGFIGTKRRGRDSGDVLSGITNSRTPRRVRRNVEAPASVTSPNIAGDGSCFEEVPNSTMSTFQSPLVSNSYAEPDGEGQDDMSGVP